MLDRPAPLGLSQALSAGPLGSRAALQAWPLHGDTLLRVAPTPPASTSTAAAAAGSGSSLMPGIPGRSSDGPSTGEGNHHRDHMGQRTWEEDDGTRRVVSDAEYRRLRRCLPARAPVTIAWHYL